MTSRRPLHSFRRAASDRLCAALEAEATEVQGRGHRRHHIHQRHDGLDPLSLGATGDADDSETPPADEAAGERR